MTISEPLDFPAFGMTRITLRARSAIARTESPFSFKQQVQSHPGRLWLAEIEVPPLLNQREGGEFEAFLLAADGGRRRFLLGDPARAYAEGSAVLTLQEDELLADNGSTLLADDGSPLLMDQAIGSLSVGDVQVDGNQAARSETLSLRNLHPSKADIFLPGDLIQIASGLDARLHKVLTKTASNEAGDATVDVWPPLRAAHADGTPVTLVNAKGVFRLASNVSEWQIEAPTVYGFTLQAREEI
jgi:hypothetical protein